MTERAACSTAVGRAEGLGGIGEDGHFVAVRQSDDAFVVAWTAEHIDSNDGGGHLARSRSARKEDLE